MDNIDNPSQPSHSGNILNQETSSALTGAVFWVWICAIPFILSGIVILILAGFSMLAALKAGLGMIVVSGFILIEAIIILYLGISLIRFATNISNFKNGNSSALLPAFSGLTGYFRITGILILLSIGLVVLMLVLSAGAMGSMRM